MIFFSGNYFLLIIISVLLIFSSNSYSREKMVIGIDGYDLRSKKFVNLLDEFKSYSGSELEVQFVEISPYQVNDLYANEVDLLLGIDVPQLQHFSEIGVLYPIDVNSLYTKPLYLDPSSESSWFAIGWIEKPDEIKESGYPNKRVEIIFNHQKSLPIIVGIAPTKYSTNRNMASTFLQWINSKKGKEKLSQEYFVVFDESSDNKITILPGAFNSDEEPCINPCEGLSINSCESTLKLWDEWKIDRSERRNFNLSSNTIFGSTKEDGCPKEDPCSRKYEIIPGTYDNIRIVMSCPTSNNY